MGDGQPQPADDPLAGKVALVTGAANGIGREVALRLAAADVRVVVADVDAEGGEAAAAAAGGDFVPCDVRDPEASVGAVAEALQRHGGLDLAVLNAGVTSGCGIGDDFDLERYRRAMGINLDGVVFGLNAVLPALRAGGGGAVVATASLAGLTAVPTDPIHAANKHAVVGLVRSAGMALAPEGIRLNAICPGYAETAIISGFRHSLLEAGLPIIPVGQVAAAVVTLLSAEVAGQCWYVQAGRRSEAFAFRGIPGPRVSPPGGPGAPQQVAGDR